jgi:hypothetical protein
MLFKLVPLRIFKIMNVKIAYSCLYGLWFKPLHISLKKYGHYTQQFHDNDTTIHFEHPEKITKNYHNCANHDRKLPKRFVLTHKYHYWG